MCPRVHAPQQEKSMLQLEKATHTATGARAPQQRPEEAKRKEKKKACLRKNQPMESIEEK